MKNKDLSFASLVEDINKKWGHTYVAPVVKKEEVYEEEITIEEWEEHFKD
jgi:hypothetical protein